MTTKRARVLKNNFLYPTKIAAKYINVHLKIRVLNVKLLILSLEYFTPCVSDCLKYFPLLVEISQKRFLVDRQTDMLQVIYFLIKASCNLRFLPLHRLNYDVLSCKMDTDFHNVAIKNLWCQEKTLCACFFQYNERLVGSGQPIAHFYDCC